MGVALPYAKKSILKPKTHEIQGQFTLRLDNTDLPTIGMAATTLKAAAPTPQMPASGKRRLHI
eukprot:3137130-Amphidinium_carterae.1